MEFNLAQRNAKNYMELICNIVFSLGVLTFVWPFYACCFGAANFVLRLGYLLTYSKAPQTRVYFAPLMMLNTVVTMGTAAYACYFWHSNLPF